MSIRKSLAAVLCALAVILPAAARTADPNSLDEVIKRVQAQQKSNNSLEADFRQEKTLALLAKPELSTGHFVYQKPINELGAWFNFTFSNRADMPTYVLDLAPKSKQIAKRVRHLKIWIDKKSYLTTKFEYTESDGDVTRYEFTN